MFPREWVILLAMALPSDSSMTLLNRPTGVMNEYIGYLYNSLVLRGYLRENGSKGYELTSMGRKTLTIFLNENRTQLGDIIKALQQLGIESTRKIEELVAT